MPNQSDLTTLTYIVTVPAGTMPAKFQIPVKVYSFKMWNIDGEYDQAEFFCFPAESDNVERWLNSQSFVIEWEKF